MSTVGETFTESRELSPEEARLPERVQELEGLIRIISMRPEITFQVGEPNSPWYFEFNKAIVNAPINDLLDRSMDYCRGLAMHEAAHATVTRIFDMLRSDLFSRREIHSLFNVIEDCRIETWNVVVDRGTGCAGGGGAEWMANALGTPASADTSTSDHGVGVVHSCAGGTHR